MIDEKLISVAREFLIHTDIQTLRDCLAAIEEKCENFLYRLSHSNLAETGNSLFDMKKVAASAKLANVKKILDRIE